MAFVVGIFQAADHRRRRANEVSKLLLSETGVLTQSADFAGNLGVRPLLLKGHFAVRFPRVIPATKNLQRI